MTAAEHPERAFICRVVERGERDVPVTTNPLAKALGMVIREASLGRVVAAFHAGDDWIQGNGVVQGGIVSAMLDFGMVFAVFSTIGSGTTIATLSQTTNYLRPAPAGDFTVEGAVERTGRTVAHARATLFDAAGRQVATAIAPFAVLAE